MISMISKIVLMDRHVVGLYILLVSLCAMSAITNTWRSTGGPDGGIISSLIAIDSVLIAGANPGGIYRSTDMGRTWRFAGGGTSARLITGIDTLGDILVAASVAGGMKPYALSFSYDNGVTWDENEQEWPFMGIEALTIHKNAIFIKVQAGVFYRSTDTAKTWVSLEGNIPSSEFLNINCFASQGDILFAGTTAGVMMTTNMGDTWTDISNNLPDTSYSSMQLMGNPVYSIFSFNRRVYIGVRSAVYSLENQQGNWQELLKLENDVIVKSLFVDEKVLMAGTDHGGLYCSYNSGKSWNNDNAKNLNPTWNYITSDKISIYGCTDGCVYRSADGGLNWESAYTGIVAQNIYTIASVSGVMYAGSWGSGVSVLGSNGWEPFNKGLNLWSVYSLESNDDRLFACEIGSGINLLSNDTWQLLPVYGLKQCPTCITYVRDISVTPLGIFIGGSGGLFVSQDTGKTIQRISGSDNIFDVNVLYFDTGSNTVFVGSNQGIYKLDATSMELSSQKLGNLTYSISGNNRSLFAGIWKGGVYRSDDNGDTWNKTSLSLPETVPAVAITCLGDSVFAGTDGNGVFRSIDNGETWSEFNEGLTCPLVKALYVSNNTLYAGTNGGSVFEIPLEDAAIRHSNATIRHSDLKFTEYYSDSKVQLSISESACNYFIVNIYDMSGKYVYGAYYKSNTICFPFNHSPGIYVLQIKTIDSICQKRIIVTR